MKPVRIIRFLHEGGTKDYVLLVYQGTDGSYTLMRRNGKVGTRGQIQRASIGDGNYIANEITKDSGTRHKNGYATSSDESFESISAILNKYPPSEHAWSMKGEKLREAIEGHFGTWVDIDDEEDDKTQYEAKEVERGEEWGSW